MLSFIAVLACQRCSSSKSNSHTSFLLFHPSITLALDKYEIIELFQSMGITISEDTLENMMKKYDNDSDGSIDLEEFKSMVHGMKDVPQESSRQTCGLTWLKKALGKSKKLSIVAAKKMRKLDAAYCMSDIGKVIDVGICYGDEFGDPHSAKLTWAIYIKNVKDPLVITCSKPGQVDAWMDAFRTSIRGLKSQLPPPEPTTTAGHSYLDMENDPRFNSSHSGLITGLPEPVRQSNKNRREDFEKFGPRLDWGDDSDSDEY